MHKQSSTTQRWHNLAIITIMPLRKARKTATNRTPVKKKLSTLLPAKHGDSSDYLSGNDLLLDLKPDKNYKWILEQIQREFQHKKRTPIPPDLKPMLASTTDEAFNDVDWQFEIKWDGYRALAYKTGGKTDLRSRNNLSFKRKYPSLIEAFQAWPVNAVVDGEVVILTEEGKADFASLQNADRMQAGSLFYYAFDLLWIEGIDLTKEPLSTRREVLKRILPDTGNIRYSECIDEYGIDFFAAAKANGLEGIIAKNKTSTYQPGVRTKQWYKIKVETQHEAIICGYTKKRDTDRLFSSLVLGVPQGRSVKFLGHIGTGVSLAVQEDILQKLKPLTTKKSPFKEEPLITDFVRWVKPLLVCEVRYSELTKEGVMRHASFQGLRDDKSAFEVNTAETANKALSRKTQTAPSTNLIGESEVSAVRTIDGHELKFSNLNKTYWPKEKITKGDMLNYYYEIAPYILPYMLNRPQSLNRFPNGINGESFYQKDMKGKVDDWITTFERFSESSGDAKDFLVCTNTASLLYMANLGCIEMNPWHSRIDSPHYPDWSVIDLDPANISFEKVIETARMVHEVIKTLQIPSYPKISGSTGIHIYIPLGAKYNYEQSKQLAELIATLVHNQLPSFTSLVRDPEKRKDKIYIDYLQNRPIQTICAPYSIRPKPGATASAPLHWDEVKKGLKISQFTIHSMLERLHSEGDLFSGVLHESIDLNEVLKRLASVV